MTDLEHVGSGTSEPFAQTPPADIDAAPKRRWRISRLGMAVGVVVVAAIGVGGYFGIDALSTDPPKPTASPNHVRGLPRGASECTPIKTEVVVPFDAGARGSPATSCAFVEQVRKEYSRQSTPTSGPTQLKVVSPATAKWYYLACLNSGTYVTCTGGAAAVIYLYNK